jgi:hypothetical protein
MVGQPIVITTSEALTASVVRILGLLSSGVDAELGHSGDGGRVYSIGGFQAC